MDTSRKHVTLVLGGARSGKSDLGERLVMRHAPPWLYFATAQAFDPEMRDRIDAHRRRRGVGWTTIEAPRDLATALEQTDPARPALVDCLTLWLSNEMLAPDRDPTGWRDAEAALLEAILRRPGPLVLISNEVGLGIVPETRLGREFRDAAGRLHQAIAGIADAVILCVAGQPLAVKGAVPDLSGARSHGSDG